MNIATEILREFLQINRQVSDKFRVFTDKYNLTYPQSVVLTILICDGPMPISALADAAGSANSTISGIVDRLERINLVERVRSGKDRRVVYVDITKEVRDNLENGECSFNQFTENLSKMSAKDAQVVLRGLQTLGKVMK